MMTNSTSRSRGAERLRSPEAMQTVLSRHLSGDLEDADHRRSVLEMVKGLREDAAGASAWLDEFLLARLAVQHQGLREAAAQQEALKALFETFTRPPLRVGVYLGSVQHDDIPTALVHYEGGTLIVGLNEGVDVSGLQVGQDVLLNNDRNLLLGGSPYLAQRCGETAIFSRSTPDGRLILRWRDEEILVRCGADIDLDALTEGDRVLWDSRSRIAFETIERPTESSFFIEDTPEQTFADVGGLDTQIEQLQRSIWLRHHHPEVVMRYRLKQVRSVLMVGPPGTGKTLLARAFANWLADLSSSGRSRFMNLKPAALHSPYYAESEANYREVFRVARAAGEAEPDIPIVMFFDEIDSIGSSRTSSIHRVNDRVLTALMTELDGLEDRGNILVLAATNRVDALDPALLRPGRLKDLVLDVPRPDRAAAVQILGKHLRSGIPYRVDAAGLDVDERGAEGDGAPPATEETDAGRSDDARRELIEVAVSRMFAPNADADLATLTLRDGTRRPVTARQLVSGAVLENIARAAIERACAREVDGGPAGVTREDLLEAVTAELDTAIRTLAPHNAASFVAGLPEDIDVVRVEPIESRTRHVHRYLEVA